jgi:hypothetical protein
MDRYIPIIEKLKDVYLTQQLFRDAVLANDGIIYEYQALIQYLDQNQNRSPSNSEIIISKTDLKKVLTINTIVDYIIERFPELEKDRYIVDS